MAWSYGSCARPRRHAGNGMVLGSPTYLWAAELVLRRHKRPLRAHEIVSYAQDLGLFSEGMHSRTPQKSLQARLSIEILRNAESSRFVRTASGLFFLREFLAEVPGSDLEHDRLDLSRPVRPEPYTARRRAPSPATERVLAIPREHYAPLLSFQGLQLDDGELVRRLVGGPLDYLPRTEAEETESHKQVVTYVLVTRGAKVLSFRRGTFNRAAAFLRGSLCIGFGGHVSEDDVTIFSYADSGIVANAVREIQEEIDLAPSGTGVVAPEDVRIVGLINDDSSEVGRRHVGIVMRYEVRDWATWERAERGEASINQLRWIDALSESVNLIEFEYWSQLCWRVLFPVVAKAQPAYKILRKKPFRGAHHLVIVGGIGSGKSWATRHFTQVFGYVEVNSGRVIAELLGLPPVPMTPRPQFQKVSWELVRSPDGPSRLAAALAHAAGRSGTRQVVFDGIRQLSTLQALRAASEVPIALLFVHAAPDLAYDLHCGRMRKGGEPPVERDAFMRMLSAPVELDVASLMAEADAVIYNWAGEDHYARTLSAMAEELGLRWRNEAD